MAGEQQGEQAIFESARQIQDGGQRETFLARACGGDVALRERVGKLLAAYGSSASFLESPPTAIASAAQTAREAVPPAPELRFLSPPNDPKTLGRLDHYHVLEIVGSGGFGVVLKARDEKLQRIVAVKTLAESLAASGAARQRFVREAQAAAAVRHDNVVSIYAVDDAGSVPYLVMEFVDGVSLEDKLRREGPLPLKEILRIGLQLGEGLAAAHKQGLVHRDVKPANILLENGIQRVKITDFGLARAADDASVTQTGIVAGTPQYMSPEQARGESVDQRSDLFSLGSVLYAMCTGRAPFRGTTALAVLKRLCEESPPPIREANPDVPHSLVKIVDRLHAKDPAQRYQSAQEVANLLEQELARLQHPAGSQLAVPPSARPATRPLRGWAVAAVLLAMFAVLVLTEATGLTRLVTALTGRSESPARAAARVDESAVKGVAAAGSETPIVPQSPTPQAGAFVVSGGPGVAERTFDTLAAAGSGATQGDTIEIRGNGPFVTEGIDLSDQSIAIRAGTGFRPVLTLAAESAAAGRPFILSNAGLTLEGLEIQIISDSPFEPSKAPIAIQSRRGPLRVVNCRFLLDVQPYGNAIRTSATTISLHNCEFVSNQGIAILADPNAQLVSENCVYTVPIVIPGTSLKPQSTTIALRHNTFSTVGCIGLFNQGQPAAGAASDHAAPGIVVDACDNVIDTRDNVVLIQFPLASVGPLQPQEAERLVLRTVAWNDRQNLVPENLGLLRVVQGEIRNRGPDDVPITQAQNLAEWLEFWGNEGQGNIAGAAALQGGDVYRKKATPQQVHADDFRLQPGSPGFRAGEGGKDLGADIDLVGPGAAYERWKMTPEYQEWLKETGQVRS